jgi:hypothetical protein
VGLGVLGLRVGGISNFSHDLHEQIAGPIAGHERVIANLVPRESLGAEQIG